MNRGDTLVREMDIAENEILGLKYKTALTKVQFMNELKGGLGDEIKKNPRGIRFIKKSWRERLKIWLTDIFTTF